MTIFTDQECEKKLTLGSWQFLIFNDFKTKIEHERRFLSRGYFAESPQLGEVRFAFLDKINVKLLAHNLRLFTDILRQYGKSVTLIVFFAPSFPKNPTEYQYMFLNLLKALKKEDPILQKTVPNKEDVGIFSFCGFELFTSYNTPESKMNPYHKGCSFSITFQYF